MLHSQHSSIQAIEVHQSGTLRFLRTDTQANQSAIDLAQPHRLLLPYMPLMLASLLFQSPPRRCLLLGLGGGDLVRYLHHCMPECQITAVELDAAMVEVGQRFFALPDSDKIQLIIDDAAHFVAATRQTVDTLLVDIYDQSGMPALLQDDEFYDGCYRALAPEGVMVVNLLIHHAQELQTLLGKIRQRFQRQTLCLTVSGYKNVIVVAFRQTRSTLDRTGLMQRAAELSPRFELNFAEMVDNLFVTNPLTGGKLHF